MTYASMMYGVGNVFCAICSEGRSPHLSVHPARLVHPLHPVRPFFPLWDTALHFPDQPPLLHRLSSCTFPLAQGLMAESPSQWPSWLSVREKWTTFERLQWWHSLHPIRLLAQHLFPLAECCRSIWGCIDRWFSRFQHRGWRSWRLCAHENTFHTQTVCGVGGWGIWCVTKTKAIKLLKRFHFQSSHYWAENEIGQLLVLRVTCDNSHWCWSAPRWGLMTQLTANHPPDIPQSHNLFHLHSLLGRVEVC